MLNDLVRVVKVNLGKRTEVERRFDTETGKLAAIGDYFELRREEHEEIQKWDMSYIRYLV